MQWSPSAVCLRLAASAVHRLAAIGGVRGLCTDSPQSPIARSSTAAYRLSNLGGDHNEVTLLGTVTAVRHKELHKGSGVEPFVVLHVATVFRYKDATGSGQIRSIVSRHQVSAFSANLVKVARHVSPGDRVFITGRIDYFFAGDKVRVATIHPTRIVPMLAKQLTGPPDEAAAESPASADSAFAGDFGDDVVDVGDHLNEGR